MTAYELRQTGKLQAASRPDGQFRSAVFLNPLNFCSLMSSKQARVAAAFRFAALLGQGAMAQGPAPWPLSRETVKADARAAQHTGRLTPAGEGGAGNKEANVRSTKTRAQRKAETLRAAKRGELLPAGEGQSPAKQ